MTQEIRGKLYWINIYIGDIKNKLELLESKIVELENLLKNENH